MKLNLLLNNPGGVRSGYTNVDPIAPENSLDSVRCDVTNLDTVCDAGEASELVAHDILDYIPRAQVPKVLNHWLSRLAHGGTFVLSCVDLLEVSRALVAYRLPLEEANKLLHGEQREPWEFRKDSYSLAQLVGFLKDRGLTIQKKRVENFRAIVVATRP